MCGIAGYWSTTPLGPEILATFTDLLAHRGPDGFGYLTADGGRLGLGHRRLAIIDPGPNSLQPMISADRRYAIVFNGEIFNFLEIREELESKGYHFRTESDTEVLLHAYAQWGAACQNKLNGMWAFCVWDDKEKMMFFSRDRFGVKPLYLMQTAEGVAFASEPKSFLALPWSAAGGHVDPASCRLEGVFVLSPGTCATCRGPTHCLAISRWWQPLDHIKPETASYPQQVERFRELFVDACRIRLRSDVPVATAVSGGIDSSAVLAAVHALGSESVARRPKEWSRAFHAAVHGTEHDELEYALATCQSVGAEPEIIDVLARCQPSDVDEYLYLTEGKSLTNLPAWYLYRSVREQGIRVTLDGQGADEILAGYASDATRALMLEGSWLQRPKRTLDLVKTVRALVNGSPYYEFATAHLFAIPSRTLVRIASAHPGLHSKLQPLQGDPEMIELAKSLPPLNAVLFLAVNHGIRSLLERYDMLSMSSGLEIRMPFLDWRLVSYALSLPSTSILGGGFTKRVLRDAMRPYLPAKVLRRKPKLQFQGPIKNVVQGPLKPWIDSQPVFRRYLAEPGLATASYRRWRRAGDDIVREWNVRSYPRMASARVASLRRRHLSHPDTVRQHTLTLS